MHWRQASASAPRPSVPLPTPPSGSSLRPTRAPRTCGCERSWLRCAGARPYARSRISQQGRRLVKIVRLRPKWRKPLTELERILLRPYVPDASLRGHIDDAVRRVAAAGERIHQEKRLARERREREYANVTALRAKRRGA